MKLGWKKLKVWKSRYLKEVKWELPYLLYSFIVVMTNTRLLNKVGRWSHKGRPIFCNMVGEEFSWNKFIVMWYFLLNCVLSCANYFYMIIYYWIETSFSDKLVLCISWGLKEQETSNSADADSNQFTCLPH